MSIIFWTLAMLTAAVAGAFFYRISDSVRLYNQDREGYQPDSLADANRGDGEFDLFLLRWTVILAVITAVWGTIEGVVRLIT